jgi:hypothetical protein
MQMYVAISANSRTPDLQPLSQADQNSALNNTAATPGCRTSTEKYRITDDRAMPGGNRPSPETPKLPL